MNKLNRVYDNILKIKEIKHLEKYINDLSILNRVYNRVYDNILKIKEIKHLEKYINDLSIEELESLARNITTDKMSLFLFKNNKTMQKNPYFLLYLLENNYPIKSIEYGNILFFGEFYSSIKNAALKRKIPFQEPESLSFVLSNTDISKERPGTYIDNNVIINKIKKIMNEKLDIKINITLSIFQNASDIIYDNIELFKELATNKNINIELKYDQSDKVYSLEQILKDEEFLNQIAEEIKSYNFSPLEKYIAIYDIVKNFKPYKRENEKQPESYSRGIYELLNNSYMVCAGYSYLLSNLCKRVDIPCISIGAISEEPGMQACNHARNYVNIEDKKYHINGFYVSDSTWDNKFFKYATLIMTSEEAKTRQMKMKNFDSIFIFETEDDLYSLYTDEKITLLEYIRILDHNFYEKLGNNYFDDCVPLIYSYLKSKINREYSVTEILKAIINVKRKIFKNIKEEHLVDLEMYYYDYYRKFINYESDFESCYQNYKESRLNILFNKPFLEIKKENYQFDSVILVEYLKKRFKFGCIDYKDDILSLVLFTEDKNCFEILKNQNFEYKTDYNESNEFKSYFVTLPCVYDANLTIQEFEEKLLIQLQIISNILELNNCGTKERQDIADILDLSRETNFRI